jgi:flagellar FliL protein
MAIEDEDLELDEDAGKKGKSSKVKIIIIVLVVLAMMGASIGGTLYFLGGSDEEMVAEQGDGNNEGKHKKKKKVAKDGEAVKVIYHTFEPPFVVNFEDKGVVRFLQIGLSVMTHDETVSASLKQHDPVIRNNLVLLFSSQTFKDLSSREGKEKLRVETLKEIQSILKKYTDDKGIEEAFFTSFVIQ